MMNTLNGIAWLPASAAESSSSFKMYFISDSTMLTLFSVILATVAVGALLFLLLRRRGHGDDGDR